MMKFDLPMEETHPIKIIGIGGGGCNAVNYAYRLSTIGADFIVCNTDKQALESSPVPSKLLLGPKLTRRAGGAGSMPEVGKNAALESIEAIKGIFFNDTKIVFIVAGLGGGTGSGAAPIIARVAKEQGILTIGVVSIPFSFEGKKRKDSRRN
ncbi:MAG: hypothetical protein IPI23_19295 [Bacteroidetes bacterium]|nr:hypothetical protein [Bacteroidota bacterium]